MSSVPLLYRLVVRAVRAATPLVSAGDSELSRAFAGRLRTATTFSEWGRSARDPSRPTVWFHAPSVGEGLQAQAVMEALRAKVPGVQYVFTHFSPSAEMFARRIGADVTGYLPWDVADSVTRALDAVRPDLLVFTKTEVWPVLVDEAVARGIPVALVAGTVPPGAGRRRWPARVLLRGSWARLSLVCANGEKDAVQLVELGVSEAVVDVSGDPGIDSAARRADAADAAAPYLAPFHADPRPTVVAGSTWPSDDDILVPAVARVRSRVSDLRVIVAPHEPSERHIVGLTRRLGNEGWGVATLSDIEIGGSSTGVDAVVVDRVGVLAHLYTVGTAAFVGGGFHGAGLHSVLEPAAAGLPVSFGPRHRNARAAADLIEAGGAEVARHAAGLARVLTSWLLDDEKHDYAAGRAFGYIDAHRGAAGRTAAQLATLLPS